MYYIKAAKQGHAIAKCNLGSFYFNGDGVEKDLKKAAEWFEQAKQGHADAQYNLGVCYEHGGGVPQDLNQPRIGMRKPRI